MCAPDGHGFCPDYDISKQLTAPERGQRSTTPSWCVDAMCRGGIGAQQTPTPKPPQSPEPVRGPGEIIGDFYERNDPGSPDWSIAADRLRSARDWIVDLQTSLISAVASAQLSISEMQSSNIGANVEIAVRITGGSCETVHDLRVCQEGWLPMHARGGTQLGTTFVWDEPPSNIQNRRRLVEHEKHHRDAQWAVYGYDFAWMYLIAELWDVRVMGRSCNRFEVAADNAVSGGGLYHC